MSDMGASKELHNLLKSVVEHYLGSRKVAAIVLGTYTGSTMMVGDLPVPMSMVTGNMASRLSDGDKVRLLRNDGGREYFVLEIIGKPYQTVTGG